jgi:hypothetical protein
MSWELHRQSGKNRILIITSLINCHTLLTADNCQTRVKEYWLRGRDVLLFSNLLFYNSYLVVAVATCYSFLEVTG